MKDHLKLAGINHKPTKNAWILTKYFFSLFGYYCLSAILFPLACLGLIEPGVILNLERPDKPPLTIFPKKIS